MKRSSLKYRVLKFCLFVLILSPMIFWFECDKIYIGHPNGDSIFHFSRVASLTKQLRNGVFLPTVDTNNLTNYGYTINVFYPCLFFYIPAILHLFLPLFESFMIFLVTAIGISYFLFNHLASKYFGKYSVLLFSAIYYLSPYAVMTLENRQSFSEYLAMLLAPYILLGVYLLICKGKKCLLVISMTLLAHTHLLSLFLWSIACVVAIFLFEKESLKKRFMELIKAGLVSIGLSIDFLFPCFYYLSKDDYLISQHKFSLLKIDGFDDILVIFCFVFVVLFCFLMCKFVMKLKGNYVNTKLVSLCIVLLYISDVNMDKVSLFDLSVFSFLSKIQFNFRMQTFLWLVIGILVVRVCSSFKTKYLLVPILGVYYVISIYIPTRGIIDAIPMINYCFMSVDELNHQFDGGYVAVVNNEYLSQDVINSHKEEYSFENVDTVFNDYYLDLDGFYPYNVEIINSIVYPKSERYNYNGFSIVIDNPDKHIYSVGKIYYPFYNVYQKGNTKISYISNKGYVEITGVALNGNPVIFTPCNTDIQVDAFVFSSLLLLLICLSKEVRRVLL